MNDQAHPASADPDRRPDGTFARGNRVNRKHGLYERCGLSEGDRRAMAHLRREFRASGVNSREAAMLALQILNAERLIEDYTRLETEKERRREREGFHLACRTLRTAYRRLTPPTDQSDEVPFYIQVAQARRAVAEAAVEADEDQEEQR